MRLYISADMEGIAGVASRECLLPGGFEYEQARDWMTQAVLCACETAQDLGATEIVVSDSHGNGQNVRFEQMPDYVRLVRAWPRPLGMMQGVESGPYAGAMLIGYHAAATNSAGTLSHTLSGEMFQEVRLDGVAIPEAWLSAAIAGHFGVPILAVAGDDVVVEESRGLLGDVATAILKDSLGWKSAMMISPASSRARLRDAVADGLARVSALKPVRLKGPIELAIRLRTRFVAEWLSYLRTVERIDAFTVVYRADDILDVSRFLEFLTSARTALA